MFDLFFDYTFFIVCCGACLVGIVSGVVGCFSVLKKQSLIGDCISHCALPGVVISFFLTGVKDIEVLLLGALISGVIATTLITFICKYSKVKFDSAIALMLSVFFGLGMVFLSLLKNSKNANQAGLEGFIYGQASSMLFRDVVILCLFGFVILLTICLFYKEFKVITFDRQFAITIGINVTIFETLLTALVVISIVIGLQTVGVILMSSMLIAPAIAARQWVNHLNWMIFISALIGMISSIIATMISSSYSNLPTGPILVVVVSFIVLFSILFSNKRGIFSYYINKFKGDC